MTTHWTGFPHRAGTPLIRRVLWTDDDGRRVRADVSLRRYSPTVGLASSEQQPRLLMVHGFRGDHHGMQLITDALPEYEVLIPDLPGFGETPPAHHEDGRHAEHRLEVFAGAVGALAQTLGLGGQDVLIGHSFGSLVAARQAAEASTHWAGLVLLAPLTDPLLHSRLLPGAAGVELYYRAAGLLPEAFGNQLIRARAALAVTNLTMIRAKDPKIRSHVRDQHRRHFNDYADRLTLLEAYRASTRHIIADVAAQISSPTLLLTGAQDSMSTERGRRRLRDTLPQTRLEMLRGVGHLMHYEKPAETARALRRFLDGL